MWAAVAVDRRRPVATMTSRGALRQRLMRFLIDSGRVTQRDLDANSSLITSELIDSVTLFELAIWVEEEIGRPLDLTQLALPDGWDTVDRIIAFIEQTQDGQRAR
jgi:acyl carrier protein